MRILWPHAEDQALKAKGARATCMNPHSRRQSPHALGGANRMRMGSCSVVIITPRGLGGACASTVHAWGVGSALPSEKHASFMQHMLLFSVFFRPDHSSKVDIFGTRRTFFFCVVHVTFALLYTTRKYALRTANILGRLPKYRFAVLNPCWCIERTYRLYRRGNLLEYQTVIAPLETDKKNFFVAKPRLG